MFYELTERQIEQLQGAREKAHSSRRAGEGFGVNTALLANKLMGKPIGFCYGVVNGQKATFRFMYGETSEEEHVERVKKMRQLPNGTVEEKPKPKLRLRSRAGAENGIPVKM